MATKTFEMPDIGAVHVYKRRGAKNIRISIDHEGRIRVTVPLWAPYRAALAFVDQKRTWITLHKEQRSTGLLRHGQRIGKHHTLRIEPAHNTAKVRTRTSASEVLVYYPSKHTLGDEVVQQAANQAAQKALRQQAEQLLPQRLRQLAAQRGFEFASVGVRNLKTRWGSCDSQKHITLNYYLMQLPWQLIDYVLVHELVHTQHLNHSTAFWDEVARHLPSYKTLRKELKNYQPSVLKL